MTTIRHNKRFYAWAIALLLVNSGCMKTVEEDYTAFHSKAFSPREQLAEVFAGDTAELLESNFLLIGYVDFTHNALSCYDDYTCSTDEKSHMTMDFLRDRAAFRGADRIQIIDSELTLKPAEKSVCTSTGIQASFVNGVLVTTSVCNSYANYDGFTESWQKRALLWRYEPELATAELNYEAAQKALPRLAAAKKDESALEIGEQPFDQSLGSRFDETPETDIYGERLVLAIQADNTDFLQNELGSEALQNFEQRHETSLLVLAYQLERPTVYRWLIEQEANWASTPAKHSVLEYAIVFSTPEEVSMLLEHHPYLGQYWASSENIYAALALARHIGMLEFVLDRGFSLDGVVDKKYSLLQLAIEAGNTAMAQTLIEKGVSLKSINEDAIPPLLVAIRKNNSSLIKLLLDKEASLYDSDSKGNSAIHFAAAFASPEIVNLLLERGANINQRNWGGLSPIYLSILGKNWETAEAIMQHELDYSPAKAEDLVATIRLLLYDAPGSTLSIFLNKTRLLEVSFLQDLVNDMAVGCAKFCSEESMTVLLDKGIDVNFSVGGTSLFSYAYAEENEAAMIALIKHGFREHHENSSLTSLQYALITGDVRKVRAYRLAGDSSGATGDTGD